MAYPDDNLSDKLSLITASTVPTALTGISAGQDVLVANFAGLKELVENLQAVATVLKDQKFYVPVGSIMPFAGASTEAPMGWLLCAGLTGTAVTSSAYPDLFNVLTAGGTVYPHGGSGSTTYTPDLRGRTIAGLDNMGGTDAARLNWSNTLGTAGGEQTHLIAANELAKHNHYSSGNTGGQSNDHSHYFNDTYTVNNSNGPQLGTGTTYTRWTFNTATTGNNTGGVSADHSHTFGAFSNGFVYNTSNEDTGTQTAANNMQPTILLNYLIKC